jgi:natural product biosynthesis luciferase-like monooxygenase protein
VPSHPEPPPDRPVAFGLFFFAAADRPDECYRLLIEAARYADRRGFAFVSTPERHFGRFGGPYPNPAVTTAALATVTERIQLRAGSLVAPLHATARIVEDWAMLDQLSRGRVAISFGSGWHVNDFVLAPDPSIYARRREHLSVQLQAIRAAWRSGTWTACNPAGHQVTLALYPRPAQPDLPVWLTASGNPATFQLAGQLGVNVLTHLEQQSVADLARKIDTYRAAHTAAGHTGAATVTVMQHTYVAASDDQAERAVEALRGYLATAMELELAATRDGGSMSGGRRLPAPVVADAATRHDLLDEAVRRYRDSASLIATPARCAERIRALRDAGADEIACLIDFLPDPELILDGLARLDQLREQFSLAGITRRQQQAVRAFLSDSQECG